MKKTVPFLHEDLHILRHTGHPIIVQYEKHIVSRGGDAGLMGNLKGVRIGLARFRRQPDTNASLIRVHRVRRGAVADDRRFGIDGSIGLDGDRGPRRAARRTD